MGRFVRRRTHVLKKQEKRVVPVSQNGSTVDDLQHGIDFFLVQVSDGWFRSLFEWNGADFSTPTKMLGAVKADELCQRVNRGKSLITGCHAARSSGLDMRKKEAHDLRRKIINE
jgi:hypothetical protein